MALPMIAPAATPPRTPAPTAQPKQPAFAVLGADIDARPMPVAAASPMSDLCMYSPCAIGRVPIRNFSERKSPWYPRPVSRTRPKHPLEYGLFGGNWVRGAVSVRTIDGYPT
jgi:hypothetical protein